MVGACPRQLEGGPLAVYVAGVVLSFAALLLVGGASFAALNLVVRRQSLASAGETSPPPARGEKLPPAWPLGAGVLGAFAGFAPLMLAVASSLTLRDWLTTLGEGVFDVVQELLLLGGYVNALAYRAEARTVLALPRTGVMAMHGVAACSTVVAAVFYLFLILNHRYRPYFSAIIAACCLLVIVVDVVGWVGLLLALFLPGLPPILVLLLVVSLALGGVPRCKVRFPGLSYKSLQPLSPYPTTPVPAAHAPPPGDAPATPYPVSSRAVPWAGADRKRLMSA